MSKKKPVRFEDLINAALAYTDEERHYMHAVHATPLGKKSSALRDEAQFGRGRDDPTISHQLYEQAAHLHPPADQSAAAAAARHDLAESYKYRTSGIHIENLLRAQPLYRQALQARGRDSFPSRAALTRASLASCLRQLAKECSDSEQASTLTSEATALLNEAISISEKRGAAGWIDAISYLNTLGNLHFQQELHNSAVAIFHRAEGLICRLRSLLAILEQDHARARLPRIPSYQQAALRLFKEHVERGRIMDLVLLSSAEAYIVRNNTGDRKHARNLLWDIVHDAPSEFSDRARLVLGGLLRIEGEEDAARAILRAIHQVNLPATAIPELAKEHVLLGQDEAALQILHEAIEQAIVERKEHVADYPADHLAARAQTASAVGARIYVKQGKQLAAFLTLERCAGFRHEESLRHYIWRPANPLTRKLWERRWHHATVAGMLESLASRATYVESQRVVSFLKDMVHSLSSPEASIAQESAGAQSVNAAKSIAEQIDGACLAIDPILDLRTRAKQLRVLALALDRVVATRDPRGFRRWNAQCGTANERQLLELLQEFPSDALIRFSLREDLLVICVWLEDGQLESRAIQLSMPDGLLDLLWALRENPRPDHIDYPALTTALQALDLSPVLPPHRSRRAIVLPSLWASFLPLATIGPPGKALLDHFDSILFMPSTAGLVMRQDARRPRAGGLVVIPQRTFNGNTTDLEDAAFATRLPGETHLHGSSATIAAVADAMLTADVVSIYSHGRHEGDTGPYLELRDGKFDTTLGGSRHWEGIERVELWGCQSGVNMPHDPLTPTVDEGFGFDSTLISFGVRTALGTLWTVSEIVTAYIVRSYREQLLLGSDPATALAHSQRRWRDHGISELERHLRGSVDPSEGIRRFLLAQGIDVEHTTLGTTLGAGKPLRQDELQPYLAWFACPATWGGYRFLGLPNQPARRAWSAEDERELTPDEVFEAESLEQADRKSTVEGMDDDDSGVSPEQWSEWTVEQALTLTNGSHPTPEQALLVARCYADRLLSAREHNLLSGLAWLHEVLCDQEISTEWRHRLSLEAVHLWLELAEGETVTPADLVWPRLPHNEALIRASKLLDCLPEEFEPVDRAAACARLLFLEHLIEHPPRHIGEWLGREVQSFYFRKLAQLRPEKVSQLHQAVTNQTENLETSFDHAVRAAEPFLRQIAEAEPAYSYGQRRAITLACRVLRAAPQRLPAVGQSILLLARQHLQQWEQVPQEELSSLGRMDLSQLDLQFLMSSTEPLARLEIGPLGATELSRWWTLKQHFLRIELPSAAAASSHENIGNVMTTLEARIWGGRLSFDRTILWRTTGTLGHAYRVLLNGFIGGSPPGEVHMRDAAHTIACLQLACDLRLSLLRQAIGVHASLPPQSSRAFWNLWQLPLRREKLLTALLDAALLPDSASRRDPFVLSAAQLLDGQQPADFTGQILANMLHVRQADSMARTAAFGAARLATGMTDEVRSSWKHLQEIEQKMTQTAGVKNYDFSLGKLFDPRMDIADWTDKLRTLPVGQAIVGLFTGAMDTLWCAVCWNDGTGTKERLASSDPGVASRAACLLLDLTMANRVAGLQSKWARLQTLIQPVLNAALGPVVTEMKLHLRVLAPGAFRSLPWLGLQINGMSAVDSFASIRLMPALGMPTSMQQRDAALKTACWLVTCDPTEGDTQLGEAAISTMRTAFAPRWILDVRDDVAQALPIYKLWERDNAVECLRLYSMDSNLRDTGTAASFNCGRGQVFSPLGLPGPLPHCQLAEVWAVTAGWSEQERLGREDGDTIPGLAGVLLAHGVGSVLELAWPVPDLIKALVCETYTCYRETAVPFPPMALSMAIAQVQAILSSWYHHRHSFTSVREALNWLDNERKQHYAASTLDKEDFVPFADVLVPDSADPANYITEHCEPVHLAAFRFWGV